MIRVFSNLEYMIASMDVMPDAMLEVERVIKNRLYQIAASIMYDMSLAGTPPTYPIHWDSDKQRKAFFASKGFGQGIPTSRTKAYESGWTLDAITNGVTVYNDHKGARYIAGTLRGGTRPADGGQSAIHLGRWNSFHDVVVKHLEDISQDRLQQLADDAAQAFTSRMAHA